MEVDPEKTREKKEHEGQTYFFCSAGCRKKFEQDPKRFAHDHSTGGGGDR
jgi:Cu+-exporting ATPase